MRAASSERRLARWLHGALAVWMVLGTLATTAPFSPTYAEPADQGGAGGAAAPGQPGVGQVPVGQTGSGATGRQSDAPCRRPVGPLTRNYVDVANGLAIQYPDDWSWRPRTDGLAGTRSDTVWFVPRVEAGTLPNCIMVVRTAMHYFLTDTTLEEMRESTAMVDFASLLTRALQQRIAVTPTPGLPVPLAIPAAPLPTFWGDQFTRALWGAEKQALPSGQPMYKEIGRGTVRDLLRQEYPGSIVRYVIAISPRAMLEVVGEATAAEYEAQYGRLFEQMVQSLRVADEISPNPGPVGTTVTPQRCQALFLLDDPVRRAHNRDSSVGLQPFLERSAVTQRLEVNGAAILVDPDQPDAPCPGAIDRVAIFLDPPVTGDDRAVQNISVYGLPYGDLDNSGFYLSWEIPPDLYGQRPVYFAAQLPDGSWSWVTRQINVAPPLSVAIQVSPPEAQVGERITVTMRVYNNTNNRVVGVRPVLTPNQGPGAVLLRTGPSAIPAGCALEIPTAVRPAVAPETASLGEARRPGDPLAVELLPAGIGRGVGNCVLFAWEFTALRSGSVSFSGSADGRLAGAGGRDMRLLSRSEAAPDQQPPGQQAPDAGTVSSPATTAADFQVLPVELRLERPIVVMAAADFDQAPRIEVWMLVRNTSEARIYNVQGNIEPRGVDVRGLPSPLLASGVLSSQDLERRRTEIAYLRGPGTACPSVPLAPGRLTRDQREGFQPGDTVPLLLENQCIAFVRSFELVNPSPDQPFVVGGHASGSTQHSSAQQPGDGGRRVVYPELSAVAGPYTAGLLADQPALPRRLCALLPAATLDPAPPGGPPQSIVCSTGGSGGAVLSGAPGVPSVGPGGVIEGGGVPPGLGAVAPSLGLGAVGADGGPLTGAGVAVGTGGLVSAMTGGAGGPSGALGQVGGAGAQAGSGAGASGVSGAAAAQSAADQALTQIGAFQVQQAAAAATAVNAAARGGLGPPPPPPVGAAIALQTRIRAFPAASPGARVFQAPDTIRVEMEITNLSDDTMFNIRPSNLRINGQLPTDIFTNPLAGPSGAGGSQSNIVAAAAAQAAAIAASGAGSTRVTTSGTGGTGGTGITTTTVTSTQQAADLAAVNAAEAAQRAQNLVLGDFCQIQFPPLIGGVLNQIRQLSGPNPLPIPRLRPGETGKFTWDYLIQEFREQQPRLIFQGYATAETPDGPIIGAAVDADPLERFIGCIYVQLASEPSVVQSGSIIDVTMRAHNNSWQYHSAQFGGTGRTYRDVYPLPLAAVVGLGDVSVQVLSGPTNPITSTGIELGPNAITYFTWRYQVQGAGCFVLRGQLGAQRAGGGLPFFSNTAESNQICVTAQPAATQ